jgi:hypothetical protein
MNSFDFDIVKQLGKVPEVVMTVSKAAMVQTRIILEDVQLFTRGWTWEETSMKW